MKILIICLLLIGFMTAVFSFTDFDLNPYNDLGVLNVRISHGFAQGALELMNLMVRLASMAMLGVASLSIFLAAGRLVTTVRPKGFFTQSLTHFECLPLLE